MHDNFQEKENWMNYTPPNQCCVALQSYEKRSSDILTQWNFPNDQTNWTKSDILKRQRLNLLSPDQFPTDVWLSEAAHGPFPVPSNFILFT